MGHGTTEGNQTVIRIVADLAFWAAMLVIDLGLSLIGQIMGRPWPILVLVLASLFSWLIWHETGMLSIEFDTYRTAPDTVDAAKGRFHAFMVTVRDGVLVVFAIMFIGQGFFVFQILEPQLAASTASWMKTTWKVASFVVPGIAALAGWMSRHDHPVSTGNGAGNSLVEPAYRLIVSVVLYAWLRAILALYLPASLEHDPNYNAPTLMTALVLFGPFPVRALMALRPPIRIAGTSVSLAMLVWMIFNVWGTINMTGSQWLSEPIDKARFEKVNPTPFNDDFSSYNGDAWLFYNSGSAEFAKPKQPIENGALAIRSGGEGWYFSPWVQYSNRSVIRLSMQRYIRATPGKTFISVLEVYVSASERRRPGDGTGLKPSLVLSFDTIASTILGSVDSGILWATTTGGDAAPSSQQMALAHGSQNQASAVGSTTKTLDKGVPTGVWLAEVIDWEPGTGHIAYRSRVSPGIGKEVTVGPWKQSEVMVSPVTVSGEMAVMAVRLYSSGESWSYRVLYDSIGLDSR